MTWAWECRHCGEGGTAPDEARARAGAVDHAAATAHFSIAVEPVRGPLD